MDLESRNIKLQTEEFVDILGAQLGTAKVHFEALFLSM